ncbi:MAG TPA: hypothetical protein VGK73_06850, partial [Polyangiaceae bacterium]
GDSPRYFTSLGGLSKHWAADGPGAISNPGPTGFRAYAHRDDFDAYAAQVRYWHINWLAIDPTAPIADGCTGRSDTNWLGQGSEIFVDVPFACDLGPNPLVFTSLSQVGDFVPVLGPTSIQLLSSDTFRIWVRQDREEDVFDAEYAKQHDWRIDWLAIRAPP